jgi:hypothetical protein
MYMGFFDRFKAPTPTPAPRDDGKTITMARKAGTLYYLRARNIKSGFDDILVFESEIMRRRYIGTARESTPYPSDWYFDSWETSAEKRLQAELENQRKALTDSYSKQIAQLEYKIRGLQSDNRNLQAKTNGTGQEKYNNELYANSLLRRDLQEEKQKNAELLALIQQAKERKEQEQAAQIEQHAQQKEQEQNQIIAAKESAKLILKALNPAKFEELLESLEDDTDFMTLEGAGQVRLIKYYANKILHI